MDRMVIDLKSPIPTEHAWKPFECFQEVFDIILQITARFILIQEK